jgi:patatin-like phospholipase/acyl hydrolase
MSLIDRLTSPGPKRILAIDGGGIRGAIAAGYLTRIEAILRRRHNKPELRLSDYFDLIGGTSTGAIIAAGLALGMSAEDVMNRYLTLGGAAFKKVLIPFQAKFNELALMEQLKQIFGDKLISDSAVQTGLCIVTKRADTGSIWPLINHPRGKYYPKNSGIRLRDAIRASTAAPTYFIPQDLDVGGGETGAFVDGGVSMANNPALQLFLVATLKGFPFRWSSSEDKLLLVSVGTGYWEYKRSVQKVDDSNLLTWASEVPTLLMNDASWQNQLILQYLSRSATRWEIDREVGDLANDLLTPNPVLTYLRYNVAIDQPTLASLGLNELVPKAEGLREMSDAANRNDLAKIGVAAGAKEVLDEHFPDAFNLS